MPEFLRKAEALISEDEKQEIINYIAAHTESGILMKGTGGIRKLRWAIGNKGKSGGVRIIYYYHNTHMPLFLLSLFGKSEKANLDKAERNDLAKLTNILVKNYGV
jgi:hypothetical protein